MKVCQQGTGQSEGPRSRGLRGGASCLWVTWLGRAPPTGAARGLAVNCPKKTMPLIECARCGEDEDLHARRVTDEPVTVVCGSCGHEWARDPTLRCRLCGSTDLRYTPEPLWEKGRGDQRTPAGRLDQYACWTCGGRRVTSANPVAADPEDG